MTQEAIDLSSDGVKFPYRRYLTDAATGIVGEALLIGFLWEPLKLRSICTQLSTNMEIAALIVIAVMAAPTGVAISSVTFVLISPILFFLELLVFSIARIPWLGYTLLLSVHRLSSVDSAINHFDVTWRTYFGTTARMATLAELVFPRASVRFLHLEGVVILLRNYAALSLICSFLLGGKLAIAIGQLVFAALLITAAVISFFGRCEILNQFYWYSKACLLSAPHQIPTSEIGLREFAGKISS